MRAWIPPPAGTARPLPGERGGHSLSFPNVRAWIPPPAGTARHLPGERGGHCPFVPSLRGTIPLFGGYGGGETAVPLPKPVGQPSSADGTVGVTRWESRSLPSVT